MPVAPHLASPEPATARILVVDDDRRSASGLAQWLCSLGHHASAAGSVAEALHALSRGHCDACLVDAALPDAGAAQIAKTARAANATVAVVALVMPGADLAAALASLRPDAIVSQPAADTDVLAALAAARTAVATRAADAASCPVLGGHPAIRRVLDVVDRIATTPATVLITGESGTGKSLLARLIHDRSRRAGRFIEVACGSLSETLLESELFGHVAGAFTGATRDRSGRFLQADRGTLFLDEIATASPALQVKLLRVLQQMQFEPVGGSHTHSVDARIVLATNDDLAQLVAAGRFREDLFWRINVVTLEMPPLRERTSDVLPLAVHFLSRAAAQAGRPVTGFTAEAAEALEQHRWPGNVRELEHAVERGVFLGRGPLVELADLPPSVAAARGRVAVGDAAPLKRALAVPERQLIIDALEKSGWRRDAAAKALGINRTTLYKKLKRLGMDLATIAPTP
ncbi:MAG: sigma-54 dependent transcriptional regulator [Pirellulales bacterium]